MSRGPRTGLLPSASTQAAIDLALGDIARRIARSQARQGVHPALATRHGVTGANAFVAWLFFIAPVMALFTLGGLGSPIGFVLAAPLDALGIIIAIRIRRMIQGRADQRMVYRIPTWALVVGGGCYVFGLCWLMVIATLVA